MKKFTAIVMLLPSLAHSAQMKNNIQGVGPNGSTKPYICVQNGSGQVTLKLAPGQSGDGNAASGNAYYVGATIRFGGCDYENSYLGYVGFNLNKSGNNNVQSYSPPQGVHVVYAKPSIDSSGNISGAINYTAVDPNFNMTQATQPSLWKFAGINLSGLEFGKTIEPVVIPNLSLADSTSTASDLSDTESFIKAGVNTIRLPVSWGYLQLDGAGVGSINHGYYDNYIQPLLQTLTYAKVYTIVDLHAYMRYSKFGEQYSGCSGSGPCPDGQLILDEKAYQSVWGQLYQEIKKDPKIDQNYLLFDLMNEPVGVPDDKVFTIQASVAKMLREQAFTGYILVEGNNWSGLHSWTTEQWVGQDGQTYTNANLFTRANFLKAGITDLSKIVINVHQYLDSDYSGTHDDCQQDLTTTGPSGFNLNVFTDYLAENQMQAMVTEFGTGTNSNSCASPLHQFMEYLKFNSSSVNGKTTKPYGFLGWTAWSAGHGWGNYNLRIKPTSYQMSVFKEFMDGK